MGALPEPLHQPDQLVVDLQYRDLVQTHLDRLGVLQEVPAELESPAEAIEGDDPAARRRVDDSSALGLARFKYLTDSDLQPVDLDSLIAMLRQRIGAERDGLVPILAKNRFLDSVAGAGHKPMAFEIPEPADDPGPAVDPAVSARAGAGVRIGVLDTLPLQPSDEAKTVSMYAGHSQFVEGLIRRRAPGAAILPAGVLSPVTGRADSWDTAVAMLQWADSGLDILNLSLGCYAAAGPPLVISRAIERLTPGVLVVAAAGNHGLFTHLVRGRTRDSAIWPAAIPPVIAVGAHRLTDEGRIEPAEFSPQLPWVNCTALGVEVVSEYVGADADAGVEVELPDSETRTFHGFARWSGTSFAAATVSGAIAARMVSEPGHRLSARAAFDALIEDEGQKVVARFSLGHD